MALEGGLHGAVFGAAAAAANGLTQIGAVAPEGVLQSDAGSTVGLIVGGSIAPFFFGAGGGSTNATQLELRSGTLRNIFGPSGFRVNPLAATAFALKHKLLQEGIRFNDGDSLQAFYDNANNSQVNSIFAWVSDRATLPSPDRRPFIPTRATSTTTLVAGKWTDITYAFVDSVQGGVYDVVGMRYHGATGIAARITGVPGTVLRPTVPCSGQSETGAEVLTNIGVEPFRAGNLGKWTTFNSRTPPQVQLLASSADTAATLTFDLIKVG